jgi:hypothetical protein
VELLAGDRESLAGPRERGCQRGAVDKLSMAVYLGTTYWLRLVGQGVPQVRDRCDQGCGMT